MSWAARSAYSGPLMDVFACLTGKQAGLQVRSNAKRTLHDAKIGERFEGPQRITVECVAKEDARLARTLDEVVRKNFAPKVFYFLGLGEKSVPANIEEVAVVRFRAADAADISSALFENDDASRPLLGQEIASRQAGGAGADNQSIDNVLRHDMAIQTRIFSTSLGARQTGGSIHFIYDIACMMRRFF